MLKKIKMKLKYLPVMIFLLIVVVVFISDQYLSMKQKNISVNFIITEIERLPTERLSLHSGENTVDLRNYTIMNYEDVKVGDLVRKTKEGDSLYFYRKNLETGKYEKNLVLSPVR